ncbi:MFS transporter [Rhodococcoides fascians]|uniref:MFS transporter n=1 Tax=Rhodococcoides fascians TaxID=1828 RepID=UPI0009B8065C|nr:MFS transporter [Rhodococcus fascians]
MIQPLNSSMISVAIVAITAHFGSSSGIPWIISAMYITNAVCAPLLGRVGTLFGGRRVYVAGLVLVCLGSTVGVLAPDVAWLVGAYVVLGIGISAQMPNAMIMIQTYASRTRSRGSSAVTILVTCGYSAAALGPTAGGLLIDLFGWRSILLANLPMAAASALTVLSVDLGDRPLPKLSWKRIPAALDLPGICLFVTSITSALLLLMSFRGSPLWPLIPIAGLGLLLFVLRERRTSEPFIDVHALVENRPLSAVLSRTFVSSTCYYCIFFGFPQWLQNSRQLSTVETGLVMLPVAIMGVVATVIGSWTYRKVGARCTLLLASSTLIASGILLAMIADDNASLLALLGIAVVLGLPNGLFSIGNHNLINAVTTANEVGTAIGMYRTVSFIGANLAVALISFVSIGPLDSVGLQRTGGFITLASAVLVIAIAISRQTPSYASTTQHR